MEYNDWDHSMKVKGHHAEIGKAYFSRGSDVGFVCCKHGIVAVESYGNWKVIYLKFVKDGRIYSRCIQEDYSWRYTITQAKRFAKEISLRTKET